MQKVYILKLSSFIHAYSTEDNAYRAAALWLQNHPEGIIAEYLPQFLEAIKRQDYQEVVYFSDYLVQVSECPLDAPLE